MSGFEEGGEEETLQRTKETNRQVSLLDTTAQTKGVACIQVRYKQDSSTKSGTSILDNHKLFILSFRRYIITTHKNHGKTIPLRRVAAL